MSPRNNHMSLSKPKNFKKSLGKFFKYLGKYKIGLFAALIAIVSSILLVLQGPKILGNATTEIYNGIMSTIQGGEGINFATLGKILITLIVIYGASALLSVFANLLLSDISNKMSYNLRKDIDKKILSMPFSFYDNVSKGDVLSKMTNDVDMVQQSISQGLGQTVVSVTMMIGIVVMMIGISPTMMLIAIGSLLVSLFVVSRIVKSSQKHFRKQQEMLGDVSGNVEEVYTCHEVVKAFNAEDEEIEKFNGKNDVLYNSNWRATFFSSLMMPIMSFIGNLGYVAVVIFGGIGVGNGTINIGDIQSFIMYMRNFNQNINQIAQISNQIQQMVAASERVFDFLETEEEPFEEKKLTDQQVAKLKGNVSFKNVSFGYVEGQQIIKNFTLEVQAGQKVAIVGTTGSGKTTIVKLLMRFYELNGGDIEIDGVNIKDMTREQLRSKMGMVLQDTWLFGGTIKDNLKFSKDDATMEEIVSASKAAGAHHFVKTLPGGYDLEINEEGSNISSGQKQLLTIARAILADNEIMILDEATSSVDTRTEQLIQKAMDNVSKGRTSFVIAHRLSTIKNSDVILVLDKGEIVEKGNHDQLLEKNGFYAKLYNSQFAENS